ncbi:hypothetical protein GCM10012320_13770 [Sinomonas cellulolyticus]|jgi:hypothetical protein|uniref:Zinc-finger domain-containing protein n=1 Tax=Sinomonas cellulolyticus TaxID=2801916 RepID=A0ABS1K0H4_9MICC|nr:MULTISPECIES: hypothetical protein [Sinomonas]MBL0704812.1 hypothetical protein [Sinomonas cellulolyticus]GHG47210.1 hypothetical protein GCM10012320_13770 [Sinomonas sp. KCTC 49339]
MNLPKWTGLLSDEHPASADHVQACPECRGRLETERRYLASLRHAEVPRASHSLHERLLEHTQYLAAQEEHAERSRRSGSGLARAGLSALAGAAACLAALAVTAYAVAGEPQGQQPASGDGSAALIRTDNNGSAQSGHPAVSAHSVSHAEDPLDRLGRGLRMVFGASGRP